jgi:hypothetical protein
VLRLQGSHSDNAHPNDERGRMFQRPRPINALLFQRAEFEIP